LGCGLSGIRESLKVGSQISRGRGNFGGHGGQHSQPNSLGFSNDAAFRCRYCGDLFAHSGRSASTYYSNDLASLRAPTRLENTYQLGPRREFPADKVQLVVKQTLEKYLQHEQYKPHLSALMSKQLSEVRNRSQRLSPSFLQQSLVLSAM